MEGIIGLVCCLLCAFPLFIIGYFNKNSSEPITFWSGDKTLKDKVKNVKGYDNVTVSCTIENQERADERLAIFDTLPIKHKNIVCQPMITPIHLEEHLSGVEYVVVGGESDRNARPLDYTWVLDIREQCRRQNVHFEFRQCGTHFIKDGKEYTLAVRNLCSQARKANINL